MSTNSESEEMIAEGLLRFTKMLESAGHFANVLEAIKRLFQKVPHLVSEMLEVMEEEGLDTQSRTIGVVWPKHKDRLIELAVDKVKEICSDTDVSQSLGMSSQINGYIAFLDIVLIKMKAASSARKWSVYLLLDYPSRNDEPVPIDDEGYILRTKLKKEIKNQEYLASVQADVDTDSIWMRAVTVRKTKNRVKDNQKLEQSKPTYVAYYPGEPYYYMTGIRGSQLDIVRQAMVAALGCQGDRLLPLQGKSVTSLRKMRLGRDGRDGPSINSRPEHDRFDIFHSEDSQEEADPTPHPILDSVKLEFSRPVEDMGITLDCKVEISGSDVIGGLMGMVEDGLIEEPTPAWVTNLSTAGRNSFRLNSVGGVEVGMGGRRQDDNGSVLSKATFMSIS